VWNEVSRRYVDDEPMFYIPTEWRGKPINAKQGSSSPLQDQYSSMEAALISSQYASDAYEALLKLGVAPEQARMILPQNMMTTWFWTGSMLAFHRVFRQRTDSHAQTETQDVAKQIGVICNELFPVSWSALCNTSSNS
jgi:thymidylate synthase (FAD)